VKPPAIRCLLEEDNLAIFKIPSGLPNTVQVGSNVRVWHYRPLKLTSRLPIEKRNDRSNHWHRGFDLYGHHLLVLYAARGKNTSFRRH
jgi:hypothetical protein